MGDGLRTSVLSVCLIGLMVLIAGCQNPTSSPQPDTLTPSLQPATVTPPASPTTPATEPAALPSATVIPSATRPSPTPTPTLFFNITPEIPADFLNDILFAHASPECQLPCWEGLEVGKSTSDDIQTMFETTFGFDDSIDFFGEELYISRVWIVDIPNTHTTGYEWIMNDYSLFSIQLVVDSAGILQGIQILNFTAVHQTYSPQEVFIQLGPPDSIIVTSGTTFNGNTGKLDLVLRLTINYNQGLSFRYIEGLKLDDNLEYPYCANQEDAGASYYIVEPFTGYSESDVTRLQREWLLSYSERFDMMPIDEVLGISVQEFYDLALSDDPCLSIPDLGD